MWYALCGDGTVCVDGKLFNVGAFLDICVYNESFFVLYGKNTVCFNKRLEKIYSFECIDPNSDRIIVKDKIYISGADTGCIYTYSLDGTSEKSEKAGEHICDIGYFDTISAVSYHDNIIIKNGNVKKINATPQSIIDENNIYVLAHDEFFSYIYLFDKKLTLLQAVNLPRQIGNIRKFGRKVVFGGNESICIFDEKLKNMRIKKSTGDILCRCSSCPVLENGEAVDLICGAIYRQPKAPHKALI